MVLLLGLVVAPSVRRRGVGSALVDFVARTAADPALEAAASAAAASGQAAAGDDDGDGSRGANDGKLPAEVWAKLPAYKNKAAKKAVVGMLEKRGVRILTS